MVESAGQIDSPISVSSARLHKKEKKRADSIGRLLEGDEVRKKKRKDSFLSSSSSEEILRSRSNSESSNGSAGPQVEQVQEQVYDIAESDEERERGKVFWPTPRGKTNLKRHTFTTMKSTQELLNDD